jgi:hypothetical protein
MSAAGLAISQAAMIGLYERAGLPLWVAAAAVCISIPVFNFLLMNFWVFARSRRP